MTTTQTPTPDRLKLARDALAFYADESRYHGPNVFLEVPDKWSAEAGLIAYRLDVTVDRGAIASRAIALIEAACPAQPGERTYATALQAQAEQARQLDAECGRLETLLNAMTRDRDAELAHRRNLQARVDELANMLTASAIALEAEAKQRKHLQNQLDRAKGGLT